MADFEKVPPAERAGLRSGLRSDFGTGQSRAGLGAWPVAFDGAPYQTLLCSWVQFSGRTSRLDFGPVNASALCSYTMQWRCWLLGCVACTAYTAIDDGVARSVMCVFVCLFVCWAYGWAVQKWLNRSRCRLGDWVTWIRRTLPQMGWRSDESRCTRESWQVDDAAFCQITLDICLLRVSRGQSPLRVTGGKAPWRWKPFCICVSKVSRKLILIFDKVIKSHSQWTNDSIIHCLATCLQRV